MADWFAYAQEKGMPPINNLVSLAFHPSEPLVLLNYTPLAHNTLFAHKSGWTVPLRLCRGIVFDFEGNLVAKGFPKFFNYREHAETSLLPDGEFEATVKMDGHLGIIFAYAGKLFVTTRGSFVSSTSKVAARMLADYSKKNNWQKNYPQDLTTLVEIIHPATRVLTEYGERKEFVIIGAFDRVTLEDYRYAGLAALGQKLGLPVTEMVTGRSLPEIVASMKDRAIKNQEGYVVTFPGGLRVKLKFETYIAKMIESKISYAYLMKKFVSGRLKETVELLDEEILETAKLMLGDILIQASVGNSPKDRWRSLYALVLEEDATASFRETCRKFVKALTAQAAKEV
jgi:hypothetical protein